MDCLVCIRLRICIEMKAAYILSIMLSINVLAHADDKIYTFEVNNEKSPSRIVYENRGYKTSEREKTYRNDVFWIKGIYSEDGNKKLSILINPDLRVSPKNRSFIFIQNKDDSPFETQLSVRVTYTFSDGRTVSLLQDTLRGGLPRLSPNHEINYLNFLLSDINSEKSWSVKIEVPNREPIEFTDIKVNGFREAMIKFRSGKWEKQQID